MTSNKDWKRNRNLYALWLLDQVLNKRIERPFTKVPPDGPQLDTLIPAEIKAKLSKKVQLLFRDKSQTRSPQTRSPQAPANVKIFESDCLSSEDAENTQFANYLKSESPPEKKPQKQASPKVLLDRPKEWLNVIIAEKPSREEYYRKLQTQCNCSQHD